MTDNPEQGPRLYKARRPDGEVAWVDHDELWRLQQEQAEAARRAQHRRRRVLLLLLGGLAVLAVALLLWRPWEALGPPPPAEARGPSAVPAGEAPRASAAPGEAAGTPPPAAREPAPAAPAPEERITAAVERWAAAWARQDLAAYLASYAADFEPAEGLDREAWERQRRERLLGRSSIRVGIEELEVELAGEGRAEARFVQTYDSPLYSDVVRKSLLLVEEEGEWRIARERASPP